MSQTRLIQQKFQVIFNYNIVFSHGIFSPSNPAVIDVVKKDAGVHIAKIAVVIDEGVANNHAGIADLIISYFAHYHYPVHPSHILVLPGGEPVKNDPAFVEQILTLINSARIDRHSMLIAIGGGALLDAAGYAAAIAHRGVRHIRIPTTVLSQNDSGIGVKNGINYFGKKNFIGTFTPPYAVINDPRFLVTLSDRDWRSGIAEAIKVSLIKDADFFRWIEAHTGQLNDRHLPVMEELIFRCAELHAQHISSRDPFEKGSSRPLDFGHWSAHKLEQLTNYMVTHGEAVAIGIALDATYSFLSHRIDRPALNSILGCLQELGFSIQLPIPGSELPELLTGLDEFREHLGGQLTVMLLSRIGTGEEVHELDKKLIVEAAQYINTYMPLKYTPA